MSAKEKYICSYCNREFIDYKSNHRKFCSHKCKSIGTKGVSNEKLKKRVKNICLYCKKEYEIVYSLIGISKFCNRVCHAKYYLGKNSNNLFRKGHIPWNEGTRGLIKSWNRELTKEMNKSVMKISQKMTGKKKSEEHVKQIIEKSIFQKGKRHKFWKGGISRLPYPFDFNNELKELIRKRDQYKCQKCGAPQEEFVRKLLVHHIDYNKENLSPDNLITLCNRCNTQVNFNRENWTLFFKGSLYA